MEETKKKKKRRGDSEDGSTRCDWLQSSFCFLLPCSSLSTTRPKFLFCFLPFSLHIGSHSEQPLTVSCRSKSVQTDLAMTSAWCKPNRGNAFIFTFDLSAHHFSIHFLPPAAVIQWACETRWTKWSVGIQKERATQEGRNGLIFRPAMDTLLWCISHPEQVTKGRTRFH